MCDSNSTAQALPRAFARYSAMSASRSRSSALVRLPVAIPMLAEIVSGVPLEAVQLERRRQHVEQPRRDELGSAVE